MKIDKIISFLTYPGKHAEEQPEISGATIPKEGKLFNMLSGLFDSSESDCNIPIIFLTEDDSQNNSVRDEVVKLATSKSIGDGKILAQRLQLATTEKSGMGLIFFTIGSDGANHKIVISRFPADEGIVAERSSNTLKVEFVEEVFLKSAYSYKAVMYQFPIPNHDLWTGFAVDKQVNHGAKEVAAYWISDFLKSDFQTTPKQGTKRLAMALRDAISSCQDANTKHEIVSSAKLAKNIPNKAMSIEEFCDQFHLSDGAKQQICSQVKPARLLKDKFVFDRGEFDKHLSYKMVELDNGAILSAQASKFDDCFEATSTENDNSVRFVTSGRVIDEKLRRSK
ncbi:hypothetical protein [Saccharophagus degradans]|uniref:Nucleoid-associated protein n=1 Tax=Saccharophagus degradans TaxID=86304 RepID=A0AAW7X1A7_9GAMM|nr:hypothetical protein [Saccharophagus degradans]MDO6421551.1 hypothetical protein [Saccharophagus degradans]MDO6608513.1 hypothetical protein [Saccharophagus degradans]